MAPSHPVTPTLIVELQLRSPQLRAAAFELAEGLHHNLAAARLCLHVLQSYHLLERPVVRSVTAAGTPDVHDWWWVGSEPRLAIDIVHLELNFYQEAKDGVHGPSQLLDRMLEGEVVSLDNPQLEELQDM